MNFSILVHKATHGPSLVRSTELLSDAKNEADTLYESSKSFVQAGLLKPGVAVLVMRKEDADRVVKQGCLFSSDMADVIWQAGSF